jgi:hypothetical protein
MPKLPVNSLISMALAQLFGWVLMTISDELRVSDPLGFIPDNPDKTILKWIDVILGKTWILFSFIRA